MAAAFTIPMDKTEPTASSTRYEEPFWLPVGYSTFKFVIIAPDGVTGSVTECNYTLDLHPLLSMEAASNQLLFDVKKCRSSEFPAGRCPGWRWP